MGKIVEWEGCVCLMRHSISPSVRMYRFLLDSFDKLSFEIQDKTRTGIA
jgi:hypothetical protein